MALLSWLLVAFAQAPVYHAIPVDQLELEPGAVLPRYGGHPPWDGWNADGNYPWATLEGAGEVLFSYTQGNQPAWPGRATQALGELFVRVEGPGPRRGRLFLPRASGMGFLSVAFTIADGPGSSDQREFETAWLLHYRRLLGTGVPGSAWFRHRYDELLEGLRATLGSAFDLDPGGPRPVFRDPADTLSLFSGGRAVYENLQLERGLPAAEAGEASVALESIEGISTPAFDWGPRLAPEAARLDPLARWIPADQHALFFPSFQGLLDVLDEAARIGEFSLAAFEERSGDAGTRARYEEQLCLPFDEVVRRFGALAIESVALTGSDPYLRSGSDVAVLLQVKEEALPLVLQLIRSEQEASGAPSQPVLDDSEWSARSPSRRISSNLFAILPEGPTEAGTRVVVITNSGFQSTRIREVAEGQVEALAGAEEYRFFRQRYALGEGDESALLMLPDAAIRRWCSPRWRIGSARRLRAAAALAEEQAMVASELATGDVQARLLGTDADFPELGELSLTEVGPSSPSYGTLEFLTPIAELALDRVTAGEADQYRVWRQGYQQAWSNFFDPIAARLSVTARSTILDLTVMPLILGTEYAELREASRGAGLAEGSGDFHPEGLVHFAMGINPDWETLRSVGMSLGPMGKALGADPMGWVGTWLAVYLDDGPFWDELAQAEDIDEFLGFDERLNEIPLAVTIAVAKPLQLALFLTGLRAMVDGTAPGMTAWSDRIVGERRFVQISSAGMGDEVSLFYATTPSALIFSLHEGSLLAAMERAEQRMEADTPPPEEGQVAPQAALRLKGRGLDLLQLLGDDELRRRMQLGSWRNLPILNEWQRLYPDQDPVELHQRIFRERLVCPGGGTYEWSPEWQTVVSSVFGHPGAPQEGVRLPPAWTAFDGLHSQLTFEEDGLRVRVELMRD